MNANVSTLGSLEQDLARSTVLLLRTVGKTGFEIYERFNDPVKAKEFSDKFTTNLAANIESAKRAGVVSEDTDIPRINHEGAFALIRDLANAYPTSTPDPTITPEEVLEVENFIKMFLLEEVFSASELVREAQGVLDNIEDFQARVDRRTREAKLDYSVRSKVVFTEIIRRASF